MAADLSTLNTLPQNNFDEHFARFSASRKISSNSKPCINKKFTFKSSVKLEKQNEVNNFGTNTSIKKVDSNKLNNNINPVVNQNSVSNSLQKSSFKSNNPFKKFTFKSSVKLEKQNEVNNFGTNTSIKKVDSNKLNNNINPVVNQNSVSNSLQKSSFKSNNPFNSFNIKEKFKKTSPDIRNFFSSKESDETDNENFQVDAYKSRDLKPVRANELFSNVQNEVKENMSPKPEIEEIFEEKCIDAEDYYLSKIKDVEMSLPDINIQNKNERLEKSKESEKYSSSFYQETNFRLMTKICDLLETQEDILSKHKDISNLITLRKKILSKNSSDGSTNLSNDSKLKKNLSKHSSEGSPNLSHDSKLNKINNALPMITSESHFEENKSKFSNCSDNFPNSDDEIDFVFDKISTQKFSRNTTVLSQNQSSNMSAPVKENSSIKQESSYNKAVKSDFNNTSFLSQNYSNSTLPNSSVQMKKESYPSNSLLKDNSFGKQSLECKTDNSIISFYENDSIDDIEDDIFNLEMEAGSDFDDNEQAVIGNNDQGKEEIIAGKFYGTQKDDGATQQYKGFNFPFSSDVLATFQNVFGLKQFRHNQLETINASLLGEDCFVLMPTGGGKSLCYQLPALVSAGVSIVISPLRSLIMDQVQKLCSLDIPATSLTGDVDASSSNFVYTQLASRDPSIKLLYVTPEKICASPKLISCIESLYSRNMIQRFVIDEAHCVSQWGHDFRPDYKRLKLLREKFPKVPLMALTATATQRVRGDILHQLGMKSPKWFLQSFNRPNLKYEVRPKTKAIIEEIIELLKTKFKNMCGIIYCLSRNDCDNVATILKKSGIKAASYHAGISNRDEIQEQWINDRFKVICATIAFGMGIDKPDVRFVIHHAIPKSIEGYYQESGRAGRDGERSWCILFYAYKDMQRIKRMVMQDEANRHSWSTHFDNLFKMVHYCENRTDCRRVWMLGYFGEIFDKSLCLSNPETSCDNCYSKEEFIEYDVTQDAKLVVQCVAKIVNKQQRKNFTLTYFVDIYKGAKTKKLLDAGHNKLELYGKGNHLRRTDAERFLRKLVLDQYLQEDMVINQMDLAIAYIYLGRRAKELMTGKAKVVLPFQKSSGKHPQHVSVSAEDKAIQELVEKCYDELIEVSKALAVERNMHYTNIINVEALRQMSREMPTTEEEMRAIPHVTSAIYEKYGEKFLEVTAKYGAERCVINSEKKDKDILSAIAEDTDWSDNDNGFVAASTMKGTKRKASKAASGKTTKKQRNYLQKKFQKGKGKGGYRSYAANKKKMAVQSKAPVRAPGFMPNPKTVGKPPLRSFLSTPKVVTF